MIVKLDVILKCNNILEAEQVPTREKLLSLVEWIKRRRALDKKIISKVQDDMKRLPIAIDWHGAVSNMLTMDILREELRTMSAPYSDRDLIILYLQYLSDDPCFQQLQMKYSQTNLDDEGLSFPQLREKHPYTLGPPEKNNFCVQRPEHLPNTHQHKPHRQSSTAIVDLTFFDTKSPYDRQTRCHTKV